MHSFSRLYQTVSRLIPLLVDYTLDPSRLTLTVCLSWFLSWIWTLSSRLISCISITWLVTRQTSSSLLSFSLLFTLHIYITGYGASRVPWISDLSAFRWFRRVVSLFALLYLSFRFVGTISISLLISIFIYCPAIACSMVASPCTCAMLMICLLPYRILCVADPSWSLDFESLPCYHLLLLRPVSFMLPFIICISPW